MTITLGAGVTMKVLRETLAAENQQLPVDVPNEDEATIGGVLATNWNGPRRLGYGPLRDYVIGIEAVDGRGMLFHGGGRVVKNVAGYDFCKLLTGSMGTLGVITQVTLKVRPIPAERRTLVCPFASWNDTEAFLAALSQSNLRPVAVNAMSGPGWELAGATEVAITFEGSGAEVEWQLETLEALCETRGQESARRIDADAADRLHHQSIAFPADPDAAVVLKATLAASGVAELAAAAQAAEPVCDLLAHAASGIVFLRLATEPDDLGKLVHQRLRPVAAKHHGHVTAVSRASGGEMTQQLVWGGLGDSLTWMRRVKEQFDPGGILNPGRFVF